ncbi:hypothetical protein SAY86_013107 [Trapa natans]|uniref:histidine kinase n=1 Tax=Trapa natans TaxID=22666 RepID=A0AAN7MDY5_TRANT|nr:hypothetical protein SAY86_013107 [Trapa natans]
MPPNCQLSSSNGKLSPNLKFNKKAKEPPNVPIRLRRWRRKLFHLWLVLIVTISIVWFLVDFSGRPLAREMKSAEICEEVQMEHLNASQHKLHGLPPALSKWNQVQCSDKDDLQKQLVSIMDIELVDEYPHPNEGFVHKYGPLKPHVSQYKFWNPGKESTPRNSVLCENLSILLIVSFLYKVTSGLTDEGNCGHCKTSLSFCLVKRGWWAVILVILSFKFSILYFKRWNKQKQNKAVQLEPVIQSQRQSSLLQQRWQQQPPGPPKGAGKWRKTLLKIVILFGIMISISLFWYWNEIISFRREEMLGNMCEERARMLQDQFNVSMNHVHALAILVSTFHHEKKPSAIDQFTRRGHIFVSVHLAEEVQSHSGVRDKVLCHSLRSVKGISQRSCDTLSGYPVADRSKSWEKFKSFSGTSCYCRNDETGPVEVLVTVEDTGVGIPLDAQGQIFTPFMQADSSTSRTYGGTGIGLSISKCLVDLMHGEIGFVSEPSLGSTFSFMIPFTKKGTHLPNVTLHDCDPLVSEFQGLRALVIDYRVIRAEVTRYHLSRLGIYVDIAQNFNSASTFLSRSGQKSQQSRYTMFLIHKDVWEAEGPSEFNRLLREPQKMSKDEIFVNSPKIFLFATFIDPTERIKFKSDGFVHNMLVMPLRPRSPRKRQEETWI